MDKVTGPLAPRRAIAAVLKQLREEAGKNLQDVASDLLISKSKLSRLENAQGRPLPRDIRDLIRYYAIDGSALANRLQRWVKDAQRPGWWTDFDVLLGAGGLDAHVAYEADATIERTYTLPFLPALLQTKEYATAIFRDMEHRSDEELEQLVEVRLRRQAALRSREGLPPLQLVAVTHESTLRQTIGSRAIMRAQLDALAERPPDPQVRLYVLPFSATPVFSMTCMYAYFDYDEAGSLGQDVVHIETHAGFLNIEDSEQVARYRSAHEALVRASLSEDDSRALIRSIREEHYD
ncbi:MAG TPA: Scr1 family TA system antitoxin-like transcriptional regulator [Streptosporangiaceae bacterium]|nr:Scr1 family TA system antitoxin-like transcriptional regulator [Streptosporangiaceae bacterium]